MRSAWPLFLLALWLASACGDGMLRGGPLHATPAASPTDETRARGVLAPDADDDPGGSGEPRGGGAVDAPAPAAPGTADPGATAGGGAAGGSDSSSGPTVAGCPAFPVGQPGASDLSAFNADISALPVRPGSSAIVAWIGADKGLHRDFGPGSNGIPFVVAAADQPLVKVTFYAYGDESDPGPEGWLVPHAVTRQPIPLTAPVEAGLDRHVLVLDPRSCMLYELFEAERDGAGWRAACGATFDLRRGALRAIGNTSADAAGLPMIPALTRYEEVAAGEIRHALRFTVRATRKAFVLPATHYTSTGSLVEMPAMGMRFRLKAQVDLSGFSAVNRVILTALKRYGMFVADNGGDWFLSGVPDDRWTASDFTELKTRIRGADFEVVDTGPVRTSY